MTGDGLLERARVKSGLTRGQLAAKAGVAATSVGDAERRGARASLAVLARYGDAMGLKLRVAFETADGEIIDLGGNDPVGDTEQAFEKWLSDFYLHHYVFSKGDMRAAFAAGARTAGPGGTSSPPGPETPLTQQGECSGD